MRFQVTFSESAVVTLNNTVELEAESEQHAIELVRSGAAWHLLDGAFIEVDRSLASVHSAETELDGDFHATRVG